MATRPVKADDTWRNVREQRETAGTESVGGPFLKGFDVFFTGFLIGQGSAPTFSVNAVEVLSLVCFFKQDAVLG